jgi:hypothetical protein
MKTSTCVVARLDTSRSKLFRPKQKHMIGISKSLVVHIRRKSPDMDGVRVLHCTDTTHKQDAFGRAQTKDTKPPCSLENKRCRSIQLITINYPNTPVTGTANNTQFPYDGNGNRVKIVEVTAGSVSGTKLFIFAQGGMCEPSVSMITETTYAV